MKALPTLDYDTTRQYDVTVRCTDSKDPVTGTFTVYISRNNPPVFVNLQGMQNSEKINLQLKNSQLKTIYLIIKNWLLVHRGYT